MTTMHVYDLADHRAEMRTRPVLVERATVAERVGWALIVAAVVVLAALAGVLVYFAADLAGSFVG